MHLHEVTLHMDDADRDELRRLLLAEHGIELDEPALAGAAIVESLRELVELRKTFSESE